MGFGALDNDTLSIVGVNPSVFILAEIVDAHSAVLLTWSPTPGFDDAQSFDGVVVLTDDGEGFGIGVSSGGFSIGGCDFNRYLGLFSALTPSSSAGAIRGSMPLRLPDPDKLREFERLLMEIGTP